MSVSDSYLEFLRDRLNVLGPVTFRKMFGGAGVYHNGLFFALVATETLYFKVDDNKIDPITKHSTLSLSSPSMISRGRCPTTRFRQTYSRTIINSGSGRRKH
jgi:hypothetical protein